MPLIFMPLYGYDKCDKDNNFYFSTLIVWIKEC